MKKITFITTIILVLTSCSFKYPVTIDTQPEKAIINIDGQDFTTPFTVELSKGNHILTVKKALFESKTDTINVDKDSTDFLIKLSPTPEIIGIYMNDDFDIDIINQNKDEFTLSKYNFRRKEFQTDNIQITEKSNALSFKFSNRDYSLTLKDDIWTLSYLGKKLYKDTLISENLNTELLTEKVGILRGFQRKGGLYFHGNDTVYSLLVTKDEMVINRFIIGSDYNILKRESFDLAYENNDLVFTMDNKKQSLKELLPKLNYLIRGTKKNVIQSHQEYIFQGITKFSSLEVIKDYMIPDEYLNSIKNSLLVSIGNESYILNKDNNTIIETVPSAAGGVTGSDRVEFIYSSKGEQLKGYKVSLEKYRTDAAAYGNEDPTVKSKVLADFKLIINYNDQVY